jgi:DNA mismatch repair protein MutL
VQTDHQNVIWSTIACHKSLRSGKTLTYQEIVALLKALDEIGAPLTCPHGRPLFKKISIDQIEKWIGRRG